MDKKGNTLTISAAAFVLGCFIFWVANLVKLLTLPVELTTEFILRTAGMVIVPLGIIMGIL